VKCCDLPLTAEKCVSRIITDLAVFDIDPNRGLLLVEIAREISVKELEEKTGAPFQVSSTLLNF